MSNHDLPLIFGTIPPQDRKRGIEAGTRYFRFFSKSQNSKDHRQDIFDLLLPFIQRDSLALSLSYLSNFGTELQTVLGYIWKDSDPVKDHVSMHSLSQNQADEITSLFKDNRHFFNRFKLIYCESSDEFGKPITLFVATHNDAEQDAAANP